MELLYLLRKRPIHKSDLPNLALIDVDECINYISSLKYVKRTPEEIRKIIMMNKHYVDIYITMSSYIHPPQDIEMMEIINIINDTEEYYDDLDFERFQLDLRMSLREHDPEEVALSAALAFNKLIFPSEIYLPETFWFINDNLFPRLVKYAIDHGIIDSSFSKYASTDSFPYDPFLLNTLCMRRIYEKYLEICKTLYREFK